MKGSEDTRKDLKETLFMCGFLFVLAAMYAMLCNAKSE